MGHYFFFSNLNLCLVLGSFMLQLLFILPLWAAMASLPLCLKPNTRSIHSWRCSDTYWLSSAALCFWRKSLESVPVTQRNQEIGTQSKHEQPNHEPGGQVCACPDLSWIQCKCTCAVTIRGWMGRYLRPTAVEPRRWPNVHFAFGPNLDSACFPESCCRSHKTLGSTAS